MTDYTKLVAALRYCSETPEEDKDCNLCEYYPKCSDLIAKDAADAIEALQADVDTLKRTDAKRCQECLYLGQPVDEQLLPKRGKWIDDEFTSKGRCSVCGEEWSWFDNCMETFNYCPNCGAKMREVQDESAGSL